MLAENPFGSSDLTQVPGIHLLNEGYLHGKRTGAPSSLFAWSPLPGIFSLQEMFLWAVERR